MTPSQLLKPAGAFAAVALIGLAGISLTPSGVRADSGNTDPRIQTGLSIAPVKLNLKGKDRALVGIGSYIVNAQADCNGCHFSPDLGGQFNPGGNPYFGQPEVVNQKAYLGGGNSFGEFPGGAEIISRNLTPDSTGLPEGGNTLEQFIVILRTGKDFDGAHPNCPHQGFDGCLAPPFAGGLLQVMPWPVYSKMSGDDIRAIYEYLKAIPCISHKGSVGLLPNLYQTCP